MLVFNGAPKSFNIDIFQRSSFAIHPDADLLIFEMLHIILTSKLAALFAVDNLWFTMMI